MSANYGHFKFDMAKAPTFSVGELKELALEASEKLPDIRDFEHLWSKIAPTLFNKNIYASLLVGLGIIEFAKHVMTRIRDLEPGESTGVIRASVLFEKPRTNAEFCAILLEEADKVEKMLTPRVLDADSRAVIERVFRRLGVDRDEVAKLLHLPEITDKEQ